MPPIFDCEALCKRFMTLHFCLYNNKNGATPQFHCDESAFADTICAKKKKLWLEDRKVQVQMTKKRLRTSDAEPDGSIFLVLML